MTESETQLNRGLAALRLELPEAVHADFSKLLQARLEELQAPVPMLLHCPMCNERHYDVGEWATKVHHTHACQECGHVWRPAVAATMGVFYLPGFKNEPEEQS